MKKEGVLRSAGKNNQGICDEVWYSRLRADWMNKETDVGRSHEDSDTLCPQRERSSK